MVISYLFRLIAGVLSSVFESRCISVLETGQESRILCIRWLHGHIFIIMGDFIAAGKVFVGLSQLL